MTFLGSDLQLLLQLETFSLEEHHLRPLFPADYVKSHLLSRILIDFAFDEILLDLQHLLCLSPGSPLRLVAWFLEEHQSPFSTLHNVESYASLKNNRKFCSLSESVLDPAALARAGTFDPGRSSLSHLLQRRQSGVRSVVSKFRPPCSW